METTRSRRTPIGHQVMGGVDEESERAAEDGREAVAAWNAGIFNVS